MSPFKNENEERGAGRNELAAAKERLQHLEEEFHALRCAHEDLHEEIAACSRVRLKALRFASRVVDRSVWGLVLDRIQARLTQLPLFLYRWRKGDYAIVKESGLFQPEWYLAQYPEVKYAGRDPLEHYLTQGVWEGKKPNPDFDALWYVAKYKSVFNLGLHPLLHYILYGKERGFQVCDAEHDNYAEWRRRRSEFLTKHFNAQVFFKSLEQRPLITIVMPMYNSDKTFLTQSLQSVRRQLYPRWELCLVDDGSDVDLQSTVQAVFPEDHPQVKHVRLQKNGGIAAASNAGLAMATGEYVCFLDHDDLLEPHALASMALALNQNPEGEWFYSDEDKVSEKGQVSGPVFKPGWAPTLFLSCMYTCHLSMYKTQKLRSIGGFDSEYDGAQDYEMALRLLRLRPNIVHVPDVLYHWRMCEGSTALNVDTKPQAVARQVKALNKYLEDKGGHVVPGPLAGIHKAQFALRSRPRIGIVIPTAGTLKPGNDNVSFVEALIRSLHLKTSYEDYHVYVSADPCVGSALRKRLEDEGCTVIDYTEREFNFSKKVNALVEHCTEEFVALLNDDMTLITEDWIEQMLMWLQQDAVGCVGALLLFPDTSIQHAGVVCMENGPEHPYYGLPGANPGVLGSVQYAREYTAVTGACMMFRREDYLAVRGYDPQLHLNYNDVDFCLKIQRDLGKSVIYTPEAKFYHHESASKSGVAKSELDLFHSLWPELKGRDPYFSRHLEPGTFHARIDSRTPLEEYVAGCAT